MNKANQNYIKGPHFYFWKEVQHIKAAKYCHIACLQTNTQYQALDAIYANKKLVLPNYGIYTTVHSGIYILLYKSTVVYIP